MNVLQAIWLAYLSQPPGDRVLYRAIRKRRVKQILEIGIGDGSRAQRMIRLAQRYHDLAQVRYVGSDLFEAQAADDKPALSLKTAHQKLRSTGATVHLLPGEPLSALSRSANSLPGNELVLIATDQDPVSLGRAWFYLPRMLAPNAQVYIIHKAGETSGWRLLSPAEIESLVGQASRRRAA